MKTNKNLDKAAKQALVDTTTEGWDRYALWLVKRGGEGQLSQPKLNQQLSSTEFEVRLHSYKEIHHHPQPTTTQTQLVY